MNNNTKKIEYELMRLITSDSYASSFALLVIISVITSVFWNLADKTILFFLYLNQETWFSFYLYQKEK